MSQINMRQIIVVDSIFMFVHYTMHSGIFFPQQCILRVSNMPASQMIGIASLQLKTHEHLLSHFSTDAGISAQNICEMNESVMQLLLLKTSISEAKLIIFQRTKEPNKDNELTEIKSYYYPNHKRFKQYTSFE